MVLGTTAEKTPSVHRKSFRNPDFLWKLLASCDVSKPASAFNDLDIRCQFYPHCRHARMGSFRRFAVRPMDVGLQERNFQASPDSSSLVLDSVLPQIDGLLT